MYKFIILFLILACPFAYAQKTVKTRTIEKDTFASGKIKALYFTRIKETGKYGIHTYQKTTEKKIIRYREDGTKLYEQTVLTKIGVDAYPCQELMFEQKTYHPNGKLKSEWKIECDCHKVWYKEYNDKGKLLNKSYSIIKRYW
ncbi:MAG: hypothetical protein ACOZCO_00735 [Bacteroidota bacterium]